MNFSSLTPEQKAIIGLAIGLVFAIVALFAQAMGIPIIWFITPTPLP